MSIVATRRPSRSTGATRSWTKPCNAKRLVSTASRPRRRRPPTRRHGCDVHAQGCQGQAANRLRTGSVGRYGRRWTITAHRNCAKSLGKFGESGDPDSHELEPDGELAKPTPGAPPKCERHIRVNGWQPFILCDAVEACWHPNAIQEAVVARGSDIAAAMSEQMIVNRADALWWTPSFAGVSELATRRRHAAESRRMACHP